MAEIPTVRQLYSDIQYARMFLNAASREDDPARQRGLAAIGQGFAQLAQVEATWLGVTVAGPAGATPPAEPPGDAAEDGHRQLDLRFEADQQQPG